ncbi:uncharacterized protein LOC110852558 isoform X2 [Folsomia candida]|uniref:uncharacterized protein LOC110852558 isoform X2 n=1 Tax=Folsomia candida TaxID=158441 RepID=UPI0016051DA4|nr:uncharacterized protein LOC110852558 isoform X2 [Folsomia candida]
MGGDSFAKWAAKQPPPKSTILSFFKPNNIPSSSASSSSAALHDGDQVDVADDSGFDMSTTSSLDDSIASLNDERLSSAPSSLTTANDSDDDYEDEDVDSDGEDKDIQDVSYDDDDFENPPPEKLTKKNVEPTAGTSSGAGEEEKPHMKFGKLANKEGLQIPREKLLDFYERSSSTLIRDDDLLRQLKYDARYGEKQEMFFAKTPIGKRNKFTGYYIKEGSQFKSAGPRALTTMKDGVTNNRVRDEEENRARIRQAKTKRYNDAPELEVFYIGCASNRTEEQLVDYFTWHPRMGPIPLGSRTSESKLYTGVHNGHMQGFLGVRDNHPNDKNSKFRLESKLAKPNPKSMWQFMYRMCESRTTRELAESFAMKHSRAFNKRYGVEEHIITPVRKLGSVSLEAKAVKYANDGIPLITFDPDWDRSLENKYWTLDELTDLPLKIGRNELVKIWDSNRPKDRAHVFPRLSNTQDLLDKFPNPPLSFFDGKIDHYDEYLAIIESRK